MPATEQTATAWSVRLAADLSASDQAARTLLAGLSEEQLNWTPAPGTWSVGQCIEHLCATNELYASPIDAAIQEKPDVPVEQITPGWFGRWFLRSFAEASPKSKRARAPQKIQPGARVPLSVLDRFLASNESCRALILRARSKDVNRIRVRSPFIPEIRFSVGTALEIIAGHERRHLLQARRVLDSANFSGSPRP
jgi:hypothetical protein